MLTVLDSPSIRLAQEAERLRIARELHDSVVQSLSALVADLEHFQTRHLPILDQTNQTIAAKVAIWQELARESLTSMRQALGELRQPGELVCGLEYAIQMLLSEFREAGATVIFEYDTLPDQLPAEYTSHLYYIVREALTNISKHAHATSIMVSMSAFDDHLHIIIRDNGIGMNVQTATDQIYNGYQQGLIGVQERVTFMNGKLTIQSIASSGTCVDVVIPTAGLFRKQKVLNS